MLAQGKEAYKSLLQPLVANVRPRSAIDLGTGAGTWLAAVKELGATRVLGLDGPWASRDNLVIRDDEFRIVDFEAGLPNVGRFDLAICLEVLEHISPAAAQRSVDWLCERSDVILFSAAIPEQGGMHHINEAWQSDWAAKFATHGYLAYDIIRPIVWRDDAIPWWYRQNCVVYALPDVASAHGWTPSRPEALDLVHPDRFLMAARQVKRLRSRTLKGRIRSLWQRFG